MDDTTPPCSGDERFILEPHEIPAHDLDRLALTICRPCPLRDLCRAYAEAAHPIAGIWAGRTYTPRPRGPYSPRQSKTRKET